MNSTLQIFHWVAGFIIIAEGLNKLERTRPLAFGLTGCQRIVESLKSVGWCLLVLGAGGAVAAPLLRACGVIQLTGILRIEPPTLDQVCALCGFAFLIVRTRFKEACSKKLTTPEAE